MMFAITNEERTLFLTMRDKVIQWTSNINLAYVFNTAIEANVYEESRHVSSFLNFDNELYWYINEIQDLLDIENARVKQALHDTYGL